jgi:pilus assembly protein Flp/PilA
MKEMNDMLLKAFVTLQTLKARIVKDEQGQDLIEYALVVALIAFAAVAGMSGVATKINAAFTSIGSMLDSAI